MIQPVFFEQKIQIEFQTMQLHSTKGEQKKKFQCPNKQLQLSKCN